MQSKSHKMVLILKILPVVIAGLVLLAGILYSEEITAERLLYFLPENNMLAFLIIISLFCIKSLSVVIPIALLYIFVGRVYYPFWAVIVNTAGFMACITVPYCLGRFSGSDLVNRIIKKYPKIKQLNKIKTENEIFLSYIIRLVGIVPGDAVSVFLGSVKMNYGKYILGSVLGSLPNLIMITLLGITSLNPNSPAFVLSCIGTVSAAAGSFVVYYNFILKNKPNKNPVFIRK